MSKIDCSITKNYLSEKARLTHNCNIMCEDCGSSTREYPTPKEAMEAWNRRV